MQSVICDLGKFKEKASILHKIARSKGEEEAANGVGKFSKKT